MNWDYKDISDNHETLNVENFNINPAFHFLKIEKNADHLSISLKICTECLNLKKVEQINERLRF